MSDAPEDAINIPEIIKELQSSFDDERYPFRDANFDDDENKESAFIEWREEMHETWEQLVRHTAELWDFTYGHTFDTPRNDRAEWLFRRKESAFKNCFVEDCKRVIIDMMPSKPREPEQFCLFMLAALAQGSTMWIYKDCKAESELSWPAPDDQDGNPPKAISG